METRYGNPYIPRVARIEGITQETADIKTFRLVFLDRMLQERFSFQPGQFVAITVFGIGEIPLCISSPPSEKNFLDVTVRAVGNVSRAMHRADVGDFLGLRGPFGNAFEASKLEGKNVVIIAGGTGVVPLHSVALELSLNRKKYGAIDLFYGARTPADFVYKKDLSSLLPSSKIAVHLTVDTPDSAWKGGVGVVTKAIEEASPSPEDTIVLACGPPRMLCSATEVLKKMGFSEKQVFLSMERNMKCGIGKCGHCAVGGKYICLDGPVFSMDESNKMRD
jgi:NAD(P)H-flavin reductase